MANWVQQILEANPDLAVLPVAKRARRSLHLRRPDGKILGLFTGGPIHYQDEQDEWQPLDTMPLYDIGRGLWYCPGLNVVITSVGVVHLGDYSQHTRRIGLFRPSTMELLGTRDVPLGQREGDTLVAERDEWRVERRITAIGYRETLTLKVRPDIPQAQVSDFLVLETLVGGISMPNGWVEGEYAISEHWSPMPTAWDANNEPLTCRRYWRDGVLYTGIPVTELAHAAYPIVIDPDFTGSTADGWVTGSNADYPTARSTSIAYDKASAYTYCGQNVSGGTYYIWRSFLKFDTSGIGAGQNITQVNLNMTVEGDYSDTNFDVQIVKQDWSGQDPLQAGTREAAYDNCLAGTLDDSIWRNTAGIVLKTNYISGNLDVTYPDPEGNTYYSLRSDHDKDATEPTGKEDISLYTQEDLTEAYRPYLTILYEAAGGEDYPVSLSLSRVAAVAAAAQAGALGTASLVRSVGITDGALAAALGSSALGHSAGVTDEGQAATLAATLLARLLGISETRVKGVLVALSLAKLLGVTDAALAATLSAVTLGRSSGVSASALAITLASASLSRQVGLTDTNEASALANTSLSRQAGISSEGLVSALANASLGRQAGIAPTASAQALAAALLDVFRGLSLSRSRAVSTSLALARLLGLTSSGMAITEATATLALTLGIDEPALASALSGVSLSRQAGLIDAGEATTLSGVSLTREGGFSSSGLAAALASTTLSRLDGMTQTGSAQALASVLTEIFSGLTFSTFRDFLVSLTLDRFVGLSSSGKADSTASVTLTRQQIISLLAEAIVFVVVLGVVVEQEHQPDVMAELEHWPGVIAKLAHWLDIIAELEADL